MSLPLFLNLNNYLLTKIFFESKRLLNGLQLCKDVRKVLLKRLLFACNDLTHFVVKDIAKLQSRMQRSSLLPVKRVLWLEGINFLVGALGQAGKKHSVVAASCWAKYPLPQPQKHHPL